jgi:hypothetical protein
VRALEIAEAHQELANDLAAGEAEILLEQRHPFLFGQRMMRIEPSRE